MTTVVRWWQLVILLAAWALVDYLDIVEPWVDAAVRAFAELLGVDLED